jgi:vancomycin resistance protein VanJ
VAKNNAQKWLPRILISLLVTLRVSSWVYIVGMVAALILTKLFAEGHWMTTIFLYLPPGMWIAPLVVLVPVASIFDRTQILLHIAIIPLLFFHYMEWKPGSGLDPTSTNFIVISNNIGQNQKTSFWKFSEALHPDVIMLQDCGASVYRYQQDYKKTKWNVAAIDQFAIMTRHTIISARTFTDELGRVPDGEEDLVAARFVIRVDGKDVVLYNIHLPTPRDALGSLRGNGFIRSLFTGEGVYSSKVRKEFQAFMDRNRELASHIIKEASRETLPAIIAGDFNAPSQGLVANAFSKYFHDAHRLAGQGCGFTFPGQTRNPFSLFGPYLRIDYIYSNKYIIPDGSLVEMARVSQHRAIAASFNLL